MPKNGLQSNSEYAIQTYVKHSKPVKVYREAFQVIRHATENGRSVSLLLF